MDDLTTPISLVAILVGMVLAYRAGRSIAPVQQEPIDAPDPEPNPESGADEEEQADEPEASRELEEEDEHTGLQEIADRLDELFSKFPGPGFAYESDEFQKALEELAKLRLPTAELLAWIGHDDDSKAILAIEHAASRQDLNQDERRTALLAKLKGSPSDRVAWFVLRSLGNCEKGDFIAPVLARIDDSWEAEPYLSLLIDFLDRRAQRGDSYELGDQLKHHADWERTNLRDIIRRLPEAHRKPLFKGLDGTDSGDWKTTREFLQEFGTILTVKEGMLGDGSPLVADKSLLAQRESLLKRIDRDKQPRSVLLSGPKGVGKSALCHSLGAELISRGYHVFVASAAEVQSGRSYIGQMEERVKQLVSALRTQRLVWLAPDFQNFVLAGRHKFSTTSILDMLIAPMRAGEIRVVGEIADRALERVTTETPGIDTSMDIVRLPECDAERAVALATEWLATHRGRSGVRPETTTSALREAATLIDTYSPGENRPGNLLNFLKRAFDRHLERNGSPTNGIAKLTVEHFRETLAAISGLPAAMLDDRIPLDITALRSLFESRVLSQPEAVDALVRRVAMIKAGLTDSTRPLGVFLFVGPTGTGKTELAKALATFLFSSPERMIRFDMSELQGGAAVTRLTGGREVSDSLASQVRRQPFSVILLDEFEKADSSVWDLFLQVFDDGRLTDTDGNLTDFRQTIVILTSNLGARAAQGTPLGFGGRPEGYRNDEIRRAVEKTFRPEFVNRIDQVVNFRPLDRETMRKILQAQLQKIGNRRGLRDRPWTLEFDPSALDFLLNKGFAPDLGARPLLRAIERHLLGPLAEAVVKGELDPAEQLLFLFARDGTIRWDSSLDESEEALATTSSDEEVTAYSDRALILGPAGEPGELRFLDKRHQDLDELFQLSAYQDSKDELLASMSREGFWQDPARLEKLALAEYLDRIDNALRITGEQIDRLLADSWDRISAEVRRQRVSKLAQRLYLLEQAYAEVTRNPEPDFDAILALRTHESGPKQDEFLRFLTEMYQNWGQARAMSIEVRKIEGIQHAWSVSGLGAAEILRNEAGLHVLVEGRLGEVAQVEVLVSLGVNATADFNSAPQSPAIIRRYQRLPTPLVIDKHRTWRTGRLDLIKRGHFDLIGR